MKAMKAVGLCCSPDTTSGCCGISGRWRWCHSCGRAVQRQCQHQRCQKEVTPYWWATMQIYLAAIRISNIQYPISNIQVRVDGKGIGSLVWNLPRGGETRLLKTQGDGVVIERKYWMESWAMEVQAQADFWLVPSNCRCLKNFTSSGGWTYCIANPVPD